MKSKGKLYLVLIALCIIVATFFTGMTLIASAEEEVTPSLYIERFNLSFRDNVAIKYAVRTENLSAEEKLLIWSQDDVAEFNSQDDYTLGTQSRELTTVGYQLIDEVKYDIFDLTDVSAKQMTEVFYARAYVEQGGNVYYSDVAKYSVAQYAHDLKASGCTDTDLLALVDGMLEYGALAQTYFDYNTDWLATDEAYFITVEGGTLSDGTTSGFYKSGTILTATPDAPEEGKIFSHWQNSAGEELAQLTVEKDDTFTAVYKGLKFTECNSGYGVSIGTCTDTDIVIPATYNGLPVTEIIAFAECATLKSISIPASVTKIYSGAFENCTSLETITFAAGSQLNSIEFYAFYSCSSLKTVYYGGTEEDWNKIDIQAIIGGGTDPTANYPIKYYATKYFYSESIPTVTGNFWRYDKEGKVAVWKYTTVSFDANAGEGGDTIDSQSFYVGGSYTLPEPERLGYTFKGWSYDENTVIGDITWNDLAEAVTLTAVWEKVEEMADYTFTANAVLAGSETAKTCVITGYTGTGAVLLLPEYVTAIGDNAFADCSSLTSVYYCGTAEEWANINISSTGNDYLTNATAYCYSEAAPAAAGNFWRYVDGVPTPWQTAVTFDVNVETAETIYCNCGFYYYEYNDYERFEFNACDDSDSVANAIYSYRGSCTLPSLERLGYTFKGWSDGSSEELLIGDVTWDNTAVALTLTAVWEKAEEMADYTVIANAVLVGGGTETYCIITEYTGSETNVTIPDYVTVIGNETFYENTSLTSVAFGADSRLEIIGDGAFYGTSLESIAIPAYVTVICDGAFSEMYSLASLTFAEGSRLTKIGCYSFQGCYSLTSIEIPEGVTKICDGAFNGCSGIESLTIPDGVILIENGAFSDMWSLKDVTFGENSKLATISYGVFGGCTSLESVTLPSSVTIIDMYAFYECPALSSIEIPDGVTSIGDNAFYGCTSLVSVKIPDSVTTLGKGVFYNCTSLESIDMPEGVTVIDEYTFAKCVSLENITLPASVTSIGYGAFAGCGKITSITLSADVTSIGEYAFLGCSSLTTIYYGGTQADWNNGEKITIGADAIPATATVYYYSEGTPTANGNFWHYDGSGNITIWRILTYSLNGDGKGYAVTGKGNVTDTDIVIPATFNSLPVTAIGNEAFSSAAVTSISIPDSVTALGDGAFSNCASLKTVTISANSQLATIGEGAFYNCTSLTSIFIPKSVTTIEDNALYNCTSLTALYYGGTADDWGKITIVGDNYGLNGNDNLTIYYYCESTPAATGNYWHYVDGVPVKW